MNRIFEKSSGGIVYRKREGTIDVLLLERKNGKGDREYVLPKGRMEEAETAKDTALREIGEETGLELEFLEIVKFMTKINYSFIATHKDGSPVVDKDVYLFLVRYTGSKEPTPFGMNDPTITTGERFSGAKWLSLEELAKVHVKPDILSYVRKNIQYM